MNDNLSSSSEESKPEKTFKIAFGQTRYGVALTSKELTFSGFSDFCSKPKQGGKHEVWFLRGGDVERVESYTTTKGKKHGPGQYRCDKHLKSAGFLIIDGDSSIDNTESAPSPKEVHEALKKLNIKHFIYTSHSHTDKINKFRAVIPCLFDLGSLEANRKSLKATALKIIADLNNAGIPIKHVREMNVWVQIWYLPTRDNPDDGLFEHYEYLEGEDYIAVAVSEDKELSETVTVTSSTGTGLKFGDHIAAMFKTGELHTHYAPAAQARANQGRTAQQIFDELKPICEAVAAQNNREWGEGRDTNLMEAAESAVAKLKDEKKEQLGKITKLQKADLIAEEFPLHLLPNDLRTAVKEAARALKVREEVVAIIYISFTMIAMGTGITIYEKEYHLLHASIGFIGVLAPGERKSGIFNMLQRHFDKCKTFMLDQWKITKSKIESKNKLIEKQVAKLKKESPEMGTPEFETWQNQIALLEVQVEAAPETPVIYMDDATEEIITNQLIVNGGGLGVISPDARAIVANILGQYKKGNNKGEDIYIKGISGDPISKSRVTTGNGQVPRGCLNLMGLVQKDAAQELLSDVSMTGSGLLGRIFFISPASLVGTRIEEKDEMPFQSDKLVAMDNVIRSAFMCRNFELRLTEEAAELRRLYHNRIETEMGKGGIYEEDSEITNKMCSVAVKMASAFYSIEHPEKLQTDGNGFIEEAEFKNASGLVDYLMRQNLYVVKKQKGNDVVNTAEKILKAAKANHDPEIYYTSGIFKSNHISDKWKIYFDDAIDILIANNLIEFDIKGAKTFLFRLNTRGVAYVDNYL